MRVHIDQIRPEGLVVELGMDCDWAVQGVALALEGRVLDLGGSLRIRQVGKGATVHGHAEVVVEQRCDRCLAALRLRIEGEVDLYFDNGRLEGDANIGLQEDDLDVGFLENGELDLGAALGEFFLLEGPNRQICGDQGIERVEEGACDLPAKQAEGEPRVDPRLAALKNFRPD